MAQKPQSTAGLLQREMKKQSRLADDPIGPSPPETPDELRQYFGTVDLSAGDTVELHDGVEATIDGVVPALADNDVTESEIIVHFSGTDDDGEFSATLPAWMAADDLRRGNWSLKQ